MINLLWALFIWSSTLFIFSPRLIGNKRKYKITRWKSFKKIKGTYWLGFFLILVFFITTDGLFTLIREDYFRILGIAKTDFFHVNCLIKCISKNFIHINLRHLYANFIVLLISSPCYENLVGTIWFLFIFCLSGMVSSISVLFFSSHMVSAGASSGLLGLWGAYLFYNARKKEIFWGIPLMLLIIYGFDHLYQPTISFKINSLGHLLGFVTGALASRFFINNNYSTNQK